MYQAIGQAQALGGINQSGATFEFLGFQPARPVEIARGLVDQRHAVAKQRGKQLRTRQPVGKGDRAHFYATLIGHLRLRLTPRTKALRDFAMLSSTPDDEAMASFFGSMT